MSAYVLALRDVDRTMTAMVGGKGANLGELTRLDGIRVPDGFCITTDAFQRMIEAAALDGLLERLAHLGIEDRDTIRVHGGDIRRAIEATPIPEDIHEAITRQLSAHERDAFAVRSSATAEDLPTASFAGQHDTFLNIIGTPAILTCVRQCWASLFTERAVTYRARHGFAHRDVQLAVVVQKMIVPQVAGVLFTADPVTSSRKVSSIDASFGLGEALVAGLVNADTYKVRGDTIVDKKRSAKQRAIYALEGGGTEERAVAPAQQHEQALTDEQIVQLANLGRTIEAHFGCPQDIEWALVDETFHVVQSRPITTLFPIPDAGDAEKHVYVSVGHQQMMTAAMRPLGLSLFQLTAGRPMFVGGGRLFVDVTPNLASAAGREMILNVLESSDPLLGAALRTLLERSGFIESPRGDSSAPPVRLASPAGARTQIEDDPAIVSGLIERSQASIRALAQAIQSKAGSELFGFILDDIQELKKTLFAPPSTAVFMAAMDASSWINENMMRWLGEKNAADALTHSVPNNVTSEMGLALLDVADVVRRYPEVIAYLQRVRDDDFLDGLIEIEGGHQTRDALSAYLEKYGMRCAGEIDITNTRWSEKPAALVPLILSNVRAFEPGASQRRLEQGRQLAADKERELLHRLRQLPDGEQKADETRRMISLLRNFIGYREYPKYSMVSRYFIYKQALSREAKRLAAAGVIREEADIFYLSFAELHDVVRTSTLDHDLVRRRKHDHALFETLRPPRVITSDGDVPAGAYTRENVPAGALVGLAVSSGIVEGRARVLSTMEDAALEPGDILVTTFTDPSWTPLFVAIEGLVTEVGGLMTHGAVIAREYGLPAVVGVENATRLITDGQRIRVHGTGGYVELLPPN